VSHSHLVQTILSSLPLFLHSSQHLLRYDSIPRFTLAPCCSRSYLLVVFTTGNKERSEPTVILVILVIHVNLFSSHEAVTTRLFPLVMDVIISVNSSSSSVNALQRQVPNLSIHPPALSPCFLKRSTIPRCSFLLDAISLIDS
jgi:hypothetical protein